MRAQLGALFNTRNLTLSILDTKRKKLSNNPVNRMEQLTKKVCTALRSFPLMASVKPSTYHEMF